MCVQENRTRALSSVERASSQPGELAYSRAATVFTNCIVSHYWFGVAQARIVPGIGSQRPTQQGGIENFYVHAIVPRIAMRPPPIALPVVRPGHSL